MSKLVTFYYMIKVPDVFYKTIGEDLYEHLNKNLVKKYLYRFFFLLGFLNFDIVVIAEMTHFGLSLRSRETVLSAIAVAPCIGFSLLANFKQIALAVHRKSMISHFGVMEMLFPNTIEKQIEYKLHHHLTIMRRVMVGFVMVCFGYTGIFSILPVTKSTIRYWLLGVKEYERNLCFLTWYPFDAKSNLLIYWTMYLTHVWAAHVAGMAFVAADLLLVSSITQLSMHFEYIVKKLENYVVDTENDLANIRFLQELVRYHGRCLEQSEHMNKVFGFSLLLNFFIASLTICFIGFQVTTSTPEDICKYCIFLIASLVQVFLVCYYGDALIVASNSVGDAAYNQIWFEASLRYKRMLIYIIHRSQEPASIKPPTFPPISFNTYMKVISMSYRFFALLRTSYYED